MTKDQLSQLLTSGDDTQIQQAVTYFEQQNQLPQELFIECLVTFQLIEDKDLKKRFTKILKQYLPKDWHFLLQDKYSLGRYQEMEKNKGFTKRLAQMLSGFLLTLQQVNYKSWISYLFPYFPDMLWQVFFYENRFTNAEIETIIQKKPIKAIDFSFLGLTEITPFVAQMQSLESITWQSENLSKIDLTILEKLPNLKKLDISISKIKKIPLIKNLEVFIMRWSKLETLSPEIAKFINLKELDLKGNPISVIDLGILEKLPKLRKFSIWNETLEIEKSKSILDSLKSLKNLNLMGYNLTQLPNILVELTGLETLRLDFNKLFEADFSLLRNLKNLKELRLNGNMLTYLPLELAQLTNLEELNLQANKPSNSSFTPLASLKKLKKLYLSHCNISELPTELVKIIDLEELDLYHNNLSEADFTSLVNLKNLRKINLSSCGLTQLPNELLPLKQRGIEIKL